GHARHRSEGRSRRREDTTARAVHDRDNRRKPENGEWRCPKCLNLNFEKRKICNAFNCGYPKEPWKCPACNAQNAAGEFLCAACGKPHPNATEKHLKFMPKNQPNNQYQA
ncbi:unnamed protein product, partial [Amoebophrya sp. A120]